MTCPLAAAISSRGGDRGDRPNGPAPARLRRTAEQDAFEERAGSWIRILADAKGRTPYVLPPRAPLRAASIRQATGSALIGRGRGDRRRIASSSRYLREREARNALRCRRAGILDGGATTSANGVFTSITEQLQKMCVLFIEIGGSCHRPFGDDLAGLLYHWLLVRSLRRSLGQGLLTSASAPGLRPRYASRWLRRGGLGRGSSRYDEHPICPCWGRRVME